MTEPYPCRTCGHPIQETHGRPKQYCSDPCRNIWKYLSAAEREIDKIHLDPEHAKTIKGELFKIANGV